ncbi:RNA polymerase sigma factor [Balneola sp. MJW-20]|uniref:RNA polymerase sigma factor n=1 Tax=Gracilimonas aurantiaca TaxID=3234185 RepID=UPI0034677726
MNVLIAQIIFFLATSEYQGQENSELYERIKNGDKKAFRSFFDKHHKELYYFLLKKNVSSTEADDLIQQAFVYIWENRSGIDETKSLRAYLFRIAYTRMLNAFRDSKKFDGNAEIPQETYSSDPEKKIENKELKSAIDQAIASMPEKRQNVFRLCFIQEFTYKEAAEFLDVSHKTIENHMGLALKDLRKALSEVSKDFL